MFMLFARIQKLHNSIAKPGCHEGMLRCKSKVPVQGHVHAVNCNIALMPVRLATASDSLAAWTLQTGLYAHSVGFLLC